MARIAIDISGGDLKQENVIVGIDLGTTNSLIARVVEGQAQCIADHGKGVIVPSLIHFAPSGQVLVGEEARSYLTQDPTRTVYSAKRLMGKSYHDVQAHTPYFSYRILDDGTDSLVKVQIGGQYYTPVELSAHILRELKARAEHRLKTEVRQVVITVPAYFNDAQRQATRDAGKLAGLDVLRILNEPTAAALAYGIGTQPEETRTVAVYDLGGGTFDVTILQINNGIFEVLATHGDTYLGGDDIDRALMLHFASQLGVALDAQTDPSLMQVLRLLAEQAKKRLSDHPTFSHTLVLPNGTQGTLQADRALLETLAAPLVARTLDCCRHALADAQLTAPQIDEVILVGGSTRMPYVQQQVATFFGRTPLCDVNPDEVVALGAAVQADILAGNRKDLLLLDITPLSLGVETAGGLMDVIIPRNSKIPTALAKQYTTQRDGQTGMRITVFQGERELVDQNRKLAEFELKGIPAMPAGLPKVEIRFLLDADGILRVSAVELRSEVAAEIAVKPQYGLTDDEMEQMLLAGFTHAKQDVETRLQIEAREEARQLVYQAQRFLEKHAATLTDAERQQMAAAVAHLQQQVDASADKQALHAAMDALDTLSRPFAQRVMEDALRTAMVGKGVGEVE